MMLYNKQQETTHHTVMLLVSLAVLSFLLTLYSLTLNVGDGLTAPFWIVTALMVAAFFRHPLSLWPLIAAVCFSGSFLASFFWQTPIMVNLTFNFINLLEGVIGGLLLRRFLSVEQPLSNLNDWFKMVLFGAVLPTLVGASLAMIFLMSENVSPAKAFFSWTSSVVIGSLTFLPIALLFKPALFFHKGNLRWLIETCITGAFTLALSYLTLRYLPRPLTFVAVLLVWSAIRLPRINAFIVFFITLLFLSVMIALGHLAMNAEHGRVLDYSPQLPYLMLLLPASVMTMVMYAFKEEQKLISHSESRFRNAMEYSAIGMALVSVEGQWLQVNKSLCRFLGYTPTQLQELTFQQITLPEDLRADLQQLDKLSAGEINSYSIEKRYYTHKGNVVWALLTVSVVRDPDGTPLYFISQVEDINELKKTESVNNRLMERITLANQAGGVGIWEWDLVNDVISWDKKMFELYDVPQNVKPTYKLWLKCLLKEDSFEAEQKIHHSLKNNEHFKLEFRIKVKSGIRHIRSYANRVVSKNGQVERLMGICMDMTEVKQLNEALYQEKERLHITLNSIGEAVICTDIEMNITFMNPIAEKLSGWHRDEAIGQPVERILQITSGNSGSLVEDIYNGDISSIADQEMVLHCRNGGSYDIQYSLTPLTMLNGQNIGSVLVIQDITESKNMLRQLSYSASHDSLTHLANRFSFENHLRQLLQDAVEHRQCHALVFIDLDRFKAVNDSAGHAAGDALLREISAMVLGMLRSGDLLARLGGDEFALLLPNCSTEHARYISESIIHSINEYQFSWEGALYRIGASAGVTRIDANNALAAEVLSQADIACYTSKNNGRGQVTVYEAQHERMDAGRSTLSAKEQWDIISLSPVLIVAQAIAPTRVSASTSFYYLSLQLWRNESEVINESILRGQLHDPGLQYALDRRLLNEFFTRFARQVAAKGLGIALPISASGLSDQQFVNQLLHYLAECNMPARLLHLSVSSEALLHASEQMADNLLRLHDAGCRLLISQVNRAPEMLNTENRHLFDYVMIDPELIVNINDNVMNEMLVSIIHGHARRLKMHAIAGPVETDKQFATLAGIGIDLLYGEAVTSAQPLDVLLNESYFAIN